jgi:hypothetical protein
MIQYFVFLILYAASILFTITGMKGLPAGLSIVETLAVLVAIGAAALLLKDLLNGKFDKRFFTTLFAGLFFNSIILIIATQSTASYLAVISSLFGILFIFLQGSERKPGKMPEPLARVERELDGMMPFYDEKRENKAIEREFIREAKELERAEKEIDGIDVEEKFEAESNVERELSREARNLERAEKEIEDVTAVEVEKELLREAKEMENAERDMAHEEAEREKEEAIIEELKQDMKKIKGKKIKFQKKKR